MASTAEPRLEEQIALLDKGIATDESLQFYLRLLDRVGSKLPSEAGYIVNRTNQLLISKAFLFPALSVAANSQVNQEFQLRLSKLVAAVGFIQAVMAVAWILSASSFGPALHCLFVEDLMVRFNKSLKTLT